MENETRRDMLETYAKALEGDSMPLDAAKASSAAWRPTRPSVTRYCSWRALTSSPA